MKKPIFRKYERQSAAGFQRQFGKNHRGIHTNRNLGGGHKRLYRKINFKGIKYGEIGIIEDFAYDPYRNVRLTLAKDRNGKKYYLLKSLNCKIGDTIQTHDTAPINSGNTLPLKNIPLGTAIHSLEFHPGKGAQCVRAAGAVAYILAKENKYVSVKLPSGEIRNFLNHCWATVGQISEVEANQRQLVKAGRMRWKNQRPHVRGSAKNPVDHPHGGGEGRAPIGKKQPLTPWGKATLGRKTRIRNKYSNALILKQRI